MNILFVSYEYPPETGGGGIGSYLLQCNTWLNQYGHTAIIMCGTSKNTAFWETETVFRIPAINWAEFDKNLPYYIDKLNVDFDIIEGVDFRGCGLSLVNHQKNIPVLARAHTINYVVDLYLQPKLTLKGKMRFALGALRRGKFPKLPQGPQKENYSKEFLFLEKAAAIVSPSKALMETYKEHGIRNKYYHLPYLFTISNHSSTPPLSRIADSTNKIKIVFFGRLEVRKGILTIIKVIPQILKRYKNVHFFFIGNPAQSPQPSLLMDAFIRQELKRYETSVTVLPAVPYHEVGNLIQAGDIFLMPSLFDNFPVACLEVMAAGKCIIATKSGGMAEMIEDRKSGALIYPDDVKGLFNVLSELIINSSLRDLYGRMAAHSIDRYHPKIIIEQQISIYKEIIEEYRAGD
ncbi:glycosyltransferase family 4 protein (plasmid) [Pedobacter sp. BS3]|uniref:glycosyltransferase family 4 protein n=1 Tax=Pedobacter sp. BS3 TaxID=2567937 RepID=UPI0011EC284F|nr:glycosyltransferase family 4 protein [Pedobacter sp. BS3]TZF86201.1 glycosyltransferase family 4 protein [Pedobacter sp. BS3]